MKQKRVRGIMLLLAVALAALAITSGCVNGGQAQVKSGDAVQVHYTGTFANGTVFDTSAGREPLGFTVGGGRVVPGFDAGIVGMREGESKTIHIPAGQAYGPYREDLVFVVDPADIPGGESLVPGDQIGITLASGQRLPGRVVDVSPGAIVIDANHHLVGEDLTFTINLIRIG